MDSVEEGERKDPGSPYRGNVFVALLIVKTKYCCLLNEKTAAVTEYSPTDAGTAYCAYYFLHA